MKNLMVTVYVRSVKTITGIDERSRWGYVVANPWDTAAQQPVVRGGGYLGPCVRDYKGYS